MKIILYLFLLQHSSFICTGAQKAANEKALFTNKELPEVLKGTLKQLQFMFPKEKLTQQKCLCLNRYWNK